MNAPNEIKKTINGKQITARLITESSRVYAIDINGKHNGKHTGVVAGYDAYDESFYSQAHGKRFDSLEELAEAIEPTEEEVTERKEGVGYSERAAKKIAAIANPADFLFDQPTECGEFGFEPTLPEGESAVYYIGEFLGTINATTVQEMLNEARHLLAESLCLGWLGFGDLFA